MRIKQADEIYREHAPYLFEDEYAGHRVTVEPEDSEGDVYLHHTFVRYVTRAARERRSNAGWANADRSYEWSSRGTHLTRKQARKLAKELLKAADSGE